MNGALLGFLEHRFKWTWASRDFRNGARLFGLLAANERRDCANFLGDHRYDFPLGARTGRRLRSLGNNDGCDEFRGPWSGRRALGCSFLKALAMCLLRLGFLRLGLLQE